MAAIWVLDERPLIIRKRFLPFLAYEIEISEIENGRQIVPDRKGGSELLFCLVRLANRA